LEADGAILAKRQQIIAGTNAVQTVKQEDCWWFREKGPSELLAA